ncbi:MAG: DUF1329 domain-containing protein [Immundisolibacter sp.]|jgi:hypothetical protein|uniref:DUF1329 domain-containing protein n=1 Tax=Immundisolibacter sp. TaxID=1934948 RepID=UPI0019B74C9A|nr:DUF1329 domain-containing protein [Immundisolibacter sp.]MBC7161672.1 DUF1329 domain-containing protein [Immundisolibacter sp.]
MFTKPTQTLGALALLGLVSGAQAQDIAPGTVLNAANIDQLKAQTFEGKPLADLILPTQEKMIRELGLQMRLQSSQQIQVDPRLVAATKENAGKASLDDKKRLQNFVTGMPFATIDANNPADGIKLAYNFMRGPWYADVVDYNPMYFALINGQKGFEREQHWRFARYLADGALNPALKDPKGEIAKYEVVLNKYPNDSRGLGVLTIQYTDARLPDVYAYVRSVRRVRRLSSNAWSDPLSSTDLLNDESFGMSLDPSWYQEWKLLGKRWILGSAHSKIEVPAAGDQRFPMIDATKAPYWNILDDWEPREVYMVEGKPGPGHLLSRKVQYYDAELHAPMLHWQEFYDKKNELWRIENCNYRPTKRDDGSMAQTVSYVPVYDLQRLHATIVFADPKGRHNFEDAKSADFTPDAIPRLIN